MRGLRGEEEGGGVRSGPGEARNKTSLIGCVAMTRKRGQERIGINCTAGLDERLEC